MTGGAFVRRIVTGHDAGGRAIVFSDASFAPVSIATGDAEMTLVWTTATVPADINDDVDGRTRAAAAGATLSGGSVLRVVDMLPGKRSPMHRTSSIDYGVVLSGELELELDDQSVTRLVAGDIVVQRGTMHSWRNPSLTEPCRILFVLIEAAPRIVHGQPLPEKHP